MIRDLAALLATVQANQSLQPDPACSPMCRRIMAAHVWGAGRDSWSGTGAAALLLASAAAGVTPGCGRRDR